ncbi:unnamed protein product [Penicillium salamii]|uniref:Aminotransferase class I/classII large domain-containing protein n=1 Tax=Penicillium salamii TaxID=1612424 RepID=A0A9W4NDG2_9EURO|nr:unnamed protein product [Penicillium salamii]CAG8044530.1 unnamed protein product [Penicillium salamii]CAG8335269.1 unnamed protein product [Penicillium salamii]CAG8335458.1 unnamed protein product [Penicillium salamii]CAG8343901.1 unnamed protein product [Penicillium salamii]
MLSSRCTSRNETIIPSLLRQHDAVLSGSSSAIDLSTAENWHVKEILLELLHEAEGKQTEEDLSYSSGIGGCSKTRSLLAKLFNKYFYPRIPVETSHVVLAAGGSFALTALVEQICNPGDGILIATPYWAGLDISISIHGHTTVVPVHVPLSEFFSADSVRHYESAADNSSIPIKAVLVCNPHNPLGQCYPRETLQALLEFCQRRDLHYISDEVYALSAHQPAPDGFIPFSSILQLSTSETSERVHVVYSLSKDFGCSGIRLGALITRNEPIRLSAALSLHSQVSSMSTSFAYNSLLRDDSIMRISDHGGRHLKISYERITSFFKSHGIEYIPGAFGMFVFARLFPVTSIEEEQSLERCFKLNGVSLSSGTSYHFQELGWFRLCYGVRLDQLGEALIRVDRGIRCHVEAQSMQ